jgi:hypothetical protein
VEKLKLFLSTYQDGSGQLLKKDGSTLPGWRDFERAVAEAFEGVPQESKAIFDVIVPDTSGTGGPVGISCKMRGLLPAMRRTKRATLELSNASKEFWAALRPHGITHLNYRDAPSVVGEVLTGVVRGWHAAAAAAQGVDLHRSYHLVLMWSGMRAPQPKYSLLQFDLELPAATSLEWECPGNGTDQRIVGRDHGETVLEWYGESGGQLKYYPRVADALAHLGDGEFELTPMAENVTSGLAAKAGAYFPDLWDRLG